MYRWGIDEVKVIVGIMILTDNRKQHVMATTEKKRGPKDRSYVNKNEKHEVSYESKRKTPAKQFGGKKG